jgi:hypothetical protein
LEYAEIGFEVGHSDARHLFDAWTRGRHASWAPTAIADARPFTPASSLSERPTSPLPLAHCSPSLPSLALAPRLASGARARTRARPPWPASEQSSCRCCYRRCSMSSAAAVSSHAPCSAVAGAVMPPRRGCSRGRAVAGSHCPGQPPSLVARGPGHRSPASTAHNRLLPANVAPSPTFPCSVSRRDEEEEGHRCE